jgi:hypothetical protein
MFKPCFSATQVAAAIGKHAYQPVHQVMYDVFKKDEHASKIIEEIEKANDRKPTKNFKGSFMKDRDIQRSVFNALDTCKTADTAVAAELAAVELLVDAERRSHELDLKKAAGIEVSEEEKRIADTAILQATEERKRAAAAVTAAPSVESSLNAVEAACKRVVERTPNITPEMATQLLAEARGEVAKKRGLQNEDKILNTYEIDRKVVVSERNTRMLRMDKEEFSLVGRTDGYVADQNRIVDSKDRTTYWKTVPIYDEIQLRVYMHLTDATDSELVERFPNGTKRNTVFVNDHEIWADIEAGLRLTTRKMQDILANASSLEDLVFKNTVQNAN